MILHKKNCKFLGVFPSDDLPLLYAYPCCFVVNSDPSHLPGTHWLAYFAKSNESIEFFDSFGFPPTTYSLPSSHTHNTIRLQGLKSATCGQFCIYYLYSKCIGHSLASIQSHFSRTNYRWNDTQVRNYVNRISLPKLKPLAYSSSCTCNQCAH